MVTRALGVVLLVTACSAGSDAVSVSTTTTAPIPSPTSTTVVTTTTTVASTTAAPPSPTLDRGHEATTLRLSADLSALLELGPRVSGTAAEAEAVEWFATAAGEITGIVPAIQVVPLPNGATSANVWVGPIGPGEAILLVGAHIDSIAGSPGADDNGSGIVVLLEAMRRLTESPPTSIGVVFVAFGAEEVVPGFDHHYGSTAAATGMAAAGTLPDLMVSVDMVGMGEDLHATPYQGSDPSLAERLVDVAAGIGIHMDVHPRGDISDHVPFARAGVPSVMVFRGDNPGYHTPADDHVDAEAVMEALEVLEALVRDLGD